LQGKKKGGEAMPIKWNALMVSDAMDTVEEYVNQAIEPLEQAMTVAREARKFKNLPGYVDQHLVRLISEIERVTGSVLPWNQQPHPGNVRSAISSVRESLPGGAVEGEKKKLESGNQLKLAA